MTARPTNCSGRNREECPRRSKSGGSDGVPEKTIKLDGLAFQWTGPLLSVCPNILRRPEIEPQWRSQKASLGDRLKQGGTVPSTGLDTTSRTGRAKPPKAISKPYTRHLLGIYSGEGSQVRSYSLRILFVFSSYSLRILFVFSWYSHGILHVFLGGSFRGVTGAPRSRCRVHLTGLEMG